MRWDADTALLVMDVKNGIIDRYADDHENYLPRVEQTVVKARDAGIPVLFIVVRFREDYPELNPQNKMFSRVRDTESGASMTEESTATEPAIIPTDDDLVIGKKRVSAFAGSDLEMILRAQGITHLVLSGIATSGVVLSTLRYAADQDYELTVLEDCCLDGDPEVHRVLTEKVFPRQATVTTSQEWTPKGGALSRAIFWSSSCTWHQ